MSKPIILSKYNIHERDQHLLFDEPTHKYKILTDLESTYTSVTTINHSYFQKFDADLIITNMMKGKKWNEQNKYWGLTPDQIKDQWSQIANSSSRSGTNLHYEIECFMNQDLPKGYTHKDLLENYEKQILNNTIQPNNSEEWKFFLNFIRESPQFKPYRTEWTIYDEDIKIAGCIDMVYENPDGTLSIYDWKRVKEITKTTLFNKYAIIDEIDHLPDTNFWHYSLQLNTYKFILESKYGITVSDLYLVKLHPDNSKKTFELVKCANLNNEIKTLFELRKSQLNNIK